MHMKLLPGNAAAFSFIDHALVDIFLAALVARRESEDSDDNAGESDYLTRAYEPRHDYASVSQRLLRRSC